MLTARYREKPDGTTEIHVLQADGNVVIETPRERATGERAVYSLDEGSIILTGRNLRFTNAGDTITARDSLEYWQERQVAVARGDARSEERRVGIESVRPCRSRWSPSHYKQKPLQTNLLPAGTN